MKRIVERVFCVASATAFLVALSGTSWALPAAPGLMPWDGPLNAIVGYLTDVTPTVAKLAFGIAAILFAVSGSSDSTRQFAKLGLGAGLALTAVRLLNYLLPY